MDLRHNNKSMFTSPQRKFTMDCFIKDDYECTWFVSVVVVVNWDKMTGTNGLRNMPFFCDKSERLFSKSIWSALGCIWPLYLTQDQHKWINSKCLK